MTLEYVIQYRVYESIHELSELQRKILEVAYSSSQLAYAPYSNFKVGAAVLLSNNEIITGFNQENASYPCGICAERNALYSSIATYPKEQILILAISCFSQDLKKLPSTPCGLCRQVMNEIEINNKKEIELILGHPHGQIITFNTCKDLLPFGFTPDNLN